MNVDLKNLTTHIIESLAEIPSQAWDACAGSENPFISHNFLSCLEDSRSVDATNGWVPKHIIIKDRSNNIKACAPLYLKNHSHGEYVFDWGWAEAYEQAGGKYYPKLLCAIPFTPVTGPRLLVKDELDCVYLQKHMLEIMADLAAQAGLSSVHVNFVPNTETETFTQVGYLIRTGLQYHWHNDGFKTYDDFLCQLSSRKRKAIKKERKQALMNGAITIQWLIGTDITEDHWDVIYKFYTDTGARKWGQPYLNREFFSLLGERMNNQVLLIMAIKDGAYVAGALNLIGSDTLFGRYWGCQEDIRYLHFEICYHQAIDFAIKHGLKRVEAGAQGEHKIARGYLPTKTYSAHLMINEGFQAAVASFLNQERTAINHQGQTLKEESPFRKSEDLG